MMNTPSERRPSAVQIMRNLGMEPDAWQIDVLESSRPRVLLNCCRQAGKSTVVAVLAMVEALFNPLYRVLIVSQGRLFLLSTPYGKRGFYHDAWSRGGDDWARFEVPASQIPRILPHFLAEERRALGESWFQQEYCCSFGALHGVVYPDFERCVV